MSIWPAAGATGASLKQALREVQSGAMNIFAGGTGAVALIENYLKWASEAVRMLRLVMRPEDLNRLVLTSRYWATLANPAPTPAVVAAVNDEVLARQVALDAALKELDQQLAAWTPDPISRPVAYLVPDTNVLLHHAALLPDIDWHATVSDAVRTLDNLRVVIPLLGVDELDDAKRDKTRTRARQTLKLIYDRFGGDVKGVIPRRCASSRKIRKSSIVPTAGSTSV
jgi:hypothetical protein